MTVKIRLESMKNMEDIVKIAEQLPYDAEICSDKYVVNAKSILGIMSLQGCKSGEMIIHTDEKEECDKIIQMLSEADLIDESGSVEKIYDVAAFGEILIDFTESGKNSSGQKLFAQNPGGAPANVLTAVQRLGAHTAFLGKAGDDMHGKYLKDVLDSEGIDTKGLVLDDKVFTTLAFVALDDSGEREFSFARKPGADSCIISEEIDVEVLARTKIFHVGSISLTDEPAAGTTLYALDKAAENGALISYDPNYRASLWSDRETASVQMRKVIPYADIVKLSEDETELLTGIKSPEKAAEALVEQGISIAAVTLGAGGVYICTGDGGEYVEADKVKAVDTTGAGDAFLGAFLYKICSAGVDIADITLEMACEYAAFANTAAGICVERTGAIPAMPTLDEVNERLKALGKAEFDKNSEETEN